MALNKDRYRKFLQGLSTQWLQALYVDNQSLVHQNYEKLHLLELEATQRGLKLIIYKDWRKFD